jgi:hypothetical protein
MNYPVHKRNSVIDESKQDILNSDDVHARIKSKMEWTLVGFLT